MQVQGLEKLLHGYFFPVKLVHDAVGIHAVGFFDEAQQMLLVHAGGSVDVGVHLRGDRRRDAVGGFGHKRELKGHGQRDSTQSAPILKKINNNNNFLILCIFKVGIFIGSQLFVRFFK